MTDDGSPRWWRHIVAGVFGALACAWITRAVAVWWLDASGATEIVALSAAAAVGAVVGLLSSVLDGR